MRRKIAAFVAFNAHCFCILIAFYRALPDFFRMNFHSPLSPLSPFSFSDPLFAESRWDYRYFSLLLLSLMATSIAAVLTGAIVKSRGGVVAAKSAIPITIVWIEIFFVSLFTGTLASGAVSLAAVPLTILFSAYCGNVGERMQREHFPDTTIFGIYPYHFVWIVFPLFAYSVMTAAWLPYLAAALFQNWREASLSKIIVHLLSLIYTLLPFLSVCALFYAVYKILAGKIFAVRSEWGRAALAVGLLVVVPILFYRVLLVIGRLMRLISLEGN